MIGGILIACVGNIFQGDDAFGVEVARRLCETALPTGVKVVDFGIRGVDLTYALLDHHDAVILVDAAARGLEPGTLSLIEPDAGGAANGQAPLLSPHDLDPARVMLLVSALGGTCKRILLVACEPQDCDGEEGRMGLSAPVEAAIAPAVELITSLVADLQKSGARAA